MRQKCLQRQRRPNLQFFIARWGTNAVSVSAAVGFIALLGQAVLNGVLVVSAIRTRLDQGEDPWSATIEGVRERRSAARPSGRSRSW